MVESQRVRAEGLGQLGKELGKVFLSKLLKFVLNLFLLVYLLLVEFEC